MPERVHRQRWRRKRNSGREVLPNEEGKFGILRLRSQALNKEPIQILDIQTWGHLPHRLFERMPAVMRHKLYGSYLKRCPRRMSGFSKNFQDTEAIVSDKTSAAQVITIPCQWERSGSWCIRNRCPSSLIVRWIM